MEKTRWLQGAMGPPPGLIPEVERKLWGMIGKKDWGRMGERGHCTQVISEDVEALLCVPGAEVKGPGPVMGTFLWGLAPSHFHK